MEIIFIHAHHSLLRIKRCPFHFKVSDSIAYHGMWCGSYSVRCERVRENFKKSPFKGPQRQETDASFLAGKQRPAEPPLERS